MFIVTDQQLQEFGEAAFYDKVMGLFINMDLAMTKEIQQEIQGNMRQLIDKAATYHLYTEKQVAVFIFTSWLLGMDFEQKFTLVHHTLNSDALTADEKVQWLKNWVVAIFTAIES